MAVYDHIPIIGTVGTNGTERRYCKLARHAVRMGDTWVEGCCSSRDHAWCMLTAGRQRCLFWDKRNPVWRRIAQDLKCEAPNADRPGEYITAQVPDGGR